MYLPAVDRIAMTCLS